MSMNRHCKPYGFRPHLVRVIVLAMPVALLLLGSGFGALPHAVGEQRISADTVADFGEFTLPTVRSSIDGEIMIHRISAGSDAGSPETQAGTTTIVYSNTTFFPFNTHSPGAFVQIADDVRTVAGCGCPLVTMQLLIGGGGAGTGPGFGVDYAIYDDCPGDGGNIIPGTAGSATLPHDGQHYLNIDYSAQSLYLPNRFWVAVEFDSASAGWYTAGVAETGFTVDLIYDAISDPISPCEAEVGGASYSGFYISLTCNGTGIGPATPVDPNPPDGAIYVDPEQDLTWDDPGSGALTAPRVADAPTNAQVAEPAAARADPVPIGQVRATNAHPVANGGWWWCSAGAAAGSDCYKGECDNPLTRDDFCPIDGTPIKVFRVHMHVFCLPGGGDCASSQEDVDAAMLNFNTFFDLHKIQLDYVTSFHEDKRFHDYVDVGTEQFDMKNQYAVDVGTTLNIFVFDGDLGDSDSTFPWDSVALSALGGVVIANVAVNGSDMILSHEIAHTLGLWHTFRGAEIGCGPCYEFPGIPSDTTGDLCADTAPGQGQRA